MIPQFNVLGGYFFLLEKIASNQRKILWDGSLLYPFFITRLAQSLSHCHRFAQNNDQRQIQQTHSFHSPNFFSAKNDDTIKFSLFRLFFLIPWTKRLLSNTFLIFRRRQYFLVVISPILPGAYTVTISMRIFSLIPSLKKKKNLEETISGQDFNFFPRKTQYWKRIRVKEGNGWRVLKLLSGKVNREDFM